MLTMSYPYHGHGQYPENYSTPTTPHSYAQWETDPQHQPDLQHLQQQQQQPPSQQQVQAQQTFQPTIQLEAPERIVPSQHREILQGHDNNPVRLHRIHTSTSTSHQDASHEGRSEGAISTTGGTDPRIFHVDTTRLTSTSPAETSNTNTIIASSMMLRRSPRARPHHQIHPYRRPKTAAEHQSGRPRREIEQHVRFAGQGQQGQASGSVAPSPVSAQSRMTSHGSSISSPVPGTSGDTPVFSESGSGSLPEARYIIRTDVHYDPERKVVTAMLELPGVKKADVKVTLSTSQYNRVRQITVSGRSTPAFPHDSGHMHTVRERKFGNFVRTFAVPSDTKLEDIDAQMEDGILTLQISCGMPAESEDLQEIPIR